MEKQIIYLVSDPDDNHGEIAFSDKTDCIDFCVKQNLTWHRVAFYVEKQ